MNNYKKPNSIQKWLDLVIQKSSVNLQESFHRETQVFILAVWYYLVLVVAD